MGLHRYRSAAPSLVHHARHTGAGAGPAVRPGGRRNRQHGRRARRRLAQDLKLGFTSNGRANSVTVFDLDTLKVKQELPIPGQNPDAILYEPQSHKLYTFNGTSGDVTVIDA